MAAPEIAVLLRNCQHSERTTSTKIGYGLKCDNISISVAKTPIQIPLPKLSPQLIDIGVYRPSVSLSGIIDAVGGDTTNTTAGFQGMESFSFTRTKGYGAHNDARTYYIPYKNKLEDFVTDYVFTTAAPLEIEWGDANYATYNTDDSELSTGGAVYLCAVQQCRFQVDASKEDRYTFSMQFVVSARQSATGDT